MIRFYKTLHPAALFFIPFITLLLWIPGFFKANFLPAEHFGVIDGALFNVIGFLPKFLQVLFAVLLISAEAIYLNWIVNKHEVLHQNSYLPALIYAILMSFNANVINFHHLLIGNLFVLATCDKLFSLFKNENPGSLIFDCGLLLSVASLIYFPCGILFFYLLIVMSVVRVFNFKELLIAVVAFILPYYFFLAYSYVTDSFDNTISKMVEYWSIGMAINKTALIQSVQYSFVPFLIFLFIMLALSLSRLRNNYYNNSIKTRSVQQALIILSLFIVVEVLFSKKIKLFHFTQMAIPFSVFIAYYYVTAKKRLWLYETSFWVMVGLIAMSYFN